MGTKTSLMILFLIISVGIGLIFVKPKYEDVKIKQKSVDGKKVLVKELEESLSLLKKYNDRYTEREQDISKLYKVLPQGKNIAETLNQMEFLNFQTGLILESVNFTETAQQAKTQPQKAAGIGGQAATPQASQALSEDFRPKILTIDLKSSGSYESFKAFLNALETHIRLTDVQKISFSEKGEAGDIFQFSLVGNMYYR